jgi:hypothetical protein
VLDDIHIRQVKFNTEERKAIIEKNKEKYYTNRYKCVCGSYISDGNPKEQHEKTKGHKNYLEYGLKGGREEIAFKNRTINTIAYCLETIQLQRLKSDDDEERKNKKAEQREKIKCMCGITVQKKNIKGHEKSKTHINYINDMNK